MSNTYTPTTYTPTTVYQPYVPPAPIKQPEAYSTQASQQASKAVASYSTALQDLQTMGDRAIQSKYGVSRPELSQAVKEIDNSINAQKVETADESGLFRDSSGGASAGRTRLRLSPETAEDLKALSPQERQKEAAIRSDIALTAYIQFKKSLGPIREIVLDIRPSSDDPKRYNIGYLIIDQNGEKYAGTIDNINPEKMAEMNSKIEQEAAALQAANDPDKGSAQRSGQGLQLAYNPPAQDTSKDGAGSYYDYGAESTWMLTQIVDNAKQQLWERLEDLDRESAENTKFYEKKALEKKEEQKRVEAKLEKKRLDASRQAQRMQKDLETSIITDPRQMVELALKIIDLESKGRKAVA